MAPFRAKPDAGPELLLHPKMTTPARNAQPRTGRQFFLREERGDHQVSEGRRHMSNVFSDFLVFIVDLVSGFNNMLSG